MIHFFYTRLTSVLEDLVSLGDSTYADLDLDTLIRVYRDLSTGMHKTVAHGTRVVDIITERYRT